MVQSAYCVSLDNSNVNTRSVQQIVDSVQGSAAKDRQKTQVISAQNGVEISDEIGKAAIWSAGDESDDI